jgi:peptide/nickel transport system permease protein
MMLAYVLKRLLALALILPGISVLIFLLMQGIPGDPAQAILGPYATEQTLAQLRSEMALDRSMPVRYGTWISQVLKGDFGEAYSLGRPVLDEIRDRLGPTLLLAGTAFFLSTIAGIGLGILMAIRQNEWPDRVLSVGVLLGLSTPSFWLGLVLIAVFAIHWRWLPAGGMQSILNGGGIVDISQHLLLPALTLSLVATGIVARLMRTYMLDVLRLDLVRTARAKGLSEWQVIMKHALRNGLPRIIPVLGVQAGYVLGGAIYVETIFQWPGLGRMLVDAILTRDLLLVQGSVLVLATAYVLFNLAADVLQHLLDPTLADVS